jgi:hypothetical protein
MTITDLLFFLGLMTLGSFGLVLEVPELIRALASRKWFVGEAEILRAGVEKGGGRHGHVEPVVQFRYWYDGREYQGSRLVFGTPKATRVEVAKLVARFQPGTRWAVSIDPRRPHEAVIQPHPNPNKSMYALGRSTVIVVDPWLT